MNINPQKLKTLALSILLICSASPLTAGNLEDFLCIAETKFRSAPTMEEKYAVVSQPVNMEILRNADSVTGLTEEELTNNVGPDPIFKVGSDGKRSYNYHKTTPLMVAIEVGDVDRVETFLSAVSDVNDNLLSAWGYRQPYSPAHLALDAQYSRGAVSLSKRLKIVDLLGKKGADFNQIIKHSIMGIYHNPPLLAGDGRGYGFKIDEPRAQSLLYGADPAIMGSTGTFVCINPTPDCPLGTFGLDAKQLCKMAFRQLLDMSEKQKEGTHFAESVKKEFASIAEEVKAQIQEERVQNDEVLQELLTKISTQLESLQALVKVSNESDDEF